ncbi:MAG: four helix bundle protein [Flexistipes sinusarabici]|uniref:Four helix bundle protein n=1 Tax=Flexistipes sinusarabici TaxID=2352 RepID=A0A5D0MY12_FLESI|nr:four helix bundle protein [Flexistipes sinusarabici]TYB36958.1 MAG: four helix bundle protein [Flexistipes sinusarabici]
MKSDFRDLEIWQLGKALRTEVYELCKNLPKEENYKLKDQMIRASRSFTANLAEGYGRFHYQENIQFCRQARGSLFELIDHFTVCLECGYLDEDRFAVFENNIKEIVKKLNGYIKYLRTKKDTN